MTNENILKLQQFDENYNLTPNEYLQIGLCIRQGYDINTIKTIRDDIIKEKRLCKLDGISTDGTFNFLQLRELRLGKLAGIDYKSYEHYHLDAYQMRELRLALIHGVDLKKELLDACSYHQILNCSAVTLQEIRYSLMEGLGISDASNFCEYNLIHEDRLARRFGIKIKFNSKTDASFVRDNRVDLMKCRGLIKDLWFTTGDVTNDIILRNLIDDGYYKELLNIGEAKLKKFNKPQLKIIEKCLNNALDVYKLTEQVYRTEIMELIFQTLEEGVYDKVIQLAHPSKNPYRFKYIAYCACEHLDISKLKDVDSSDLYYACSLLENRINLDNYLNKAIKIRNLDKFYYNYIHTDNF